MSWHVHSPSHQRYGSDSRCLPAWPVRHLLGFSSRISAYYLLMIRVTTHARIPTVHALVNVALPLPFLYTTFNPVGLHGCTRSGLGSAFGFLSFVFHAWRSGSKIPFWHSFSLLLYHRLISCFCCCCCLLLSFSRYHHTPRLFWSTDQPRSQDHLQLIAELKHAPMARQLSGCRLLFIALFQALFLVVSDWTCTPCCRLVPHCSTWVTKFVDWVY